MSNYGDPKYWQQRYIEEGGQRFDWLQDYNTLKQHLQKYMLQGKQTKILNIGCGNGQIQDKLYDAGYENIINNDISVSLIKQMNQTNNHPKMIYEVMDVTNMTYQDQKFDLVFDKSTIDALLCSDTPLVSVAKMLKHIYRILVDGGYYFVVSYGTPSARLIHFSRKHINFDIKILQIQGRNGTPHFIYTCKKKPMKIDEKAYQTLLKELQQQDIRLINQGIDVEQQSCEQFSSIFDQSNNGIYGN